MARTTFKQLALPISLQDHAHFENFYSGDNLPIVTQLQNLLANSETKLIYLWGIRGVGLTHLLQACCHKITKQQQHAIYLPLDRVKGLSPNLLSDLESVELIALDHLEAIMGLAVWEEKIFHLYNRLIEQQTTSHHLLIVAAHRPPLQLNSHLPDLQSRLTAALTFEIKPLSEYHKKKALKQRANCRGIRLSDAVIEFLMHHYPRDMTTLCQLLELLDRRSLEAKQAITIPFIKRTLDKSDVKSVLLG